MGIGTITSNRTKILVGIFIVATCATIGSLMALAITTWNGRSVQEDIPLMKIVLTIGQISTFIISAIAIAYVFEKKPFSKYAGISLSIDGLLLVKFFALLMAIYPMAGLLASGLAQISWPEWMKGLDEKNFDVLAQLLDMSDPSLFFINILVIAFLPGIGEEMLFRGVLQKEMQQAYPHSLKPLWMAAFIFAVFHLEPIGLLTKMLIGAVLGFAYYITGNLLYSMIIHMTNNALQLTLIYFRPSLMEETVIAPPDLMQVTVSLLTIPLIILLTKHIKKEYSWMKSSRNAV